MYYETAALNVPKLFPCQKGVWGSSLSCFTLSSTPEGGTTSRLPYFSFHTENNSNERVSIIQGAVDGNGRGRLISNGVSISLSLFDGAVFSLPKFCKRRSLFSSQFQRCL